MPVGEDGGFFVTASPPENERSKRWRPVGRDLRRHDAQSLADQEEHERVRQKNRQDQHWHSLAGADPKYLGIEAQAQHAVDRQNQQSRRSNSGLARGFPRTLGGLYSSVTKKLLHPCF